MATREENLEKINAELEKLDDEQLEQIAGGSRCLVEVPNPEILKDALKLDTAQARIK